MTPPLVFEGMPFFPGAAVGQTLVAGPNEIMRLGTAAGSSGRWEPVTNGDRENPELIFYDGDVEMYFVADGS